MNLERLIVLQAQDLELKRLREELAAAPRRVRVAEVARLDAEKALKAVRESQVREELLRRGKASDAEDHRTRLTRLRRQLESATSAAQVTALEHEITFGENAVHSLEDEEIASLERTEVLEAEQITRESELKTTSAALVAEQGRSAELVRKNTAAVAATDAERVTLRASIAEDLLATFDRVSKSRGTGLAEAVEGQCTACRMKVRPQRWNDLASREHENDLFTCESCGRLLFYDPRRNTPGPWAAGDRLNAARTLAEARA